MKGLQPDETTNRVFLVVKHGTICEESRKPLAGFEPITVNNPKTKEDITKYIKRYRCVEALVTKIEYYDTEQKYDTRFRGVKIHLNADGTQCVLDLPEDSRPFTRFLKTAENIDFSEPVEFRAWMDAEKKTAFAIKQHDENVPQKYTREDMGDCPEGKQTRKGWDYTEQEDFLHEVLMNKIIPAVEAVGNPEGAGRPKAASLHEEMQAIEDEPETEIQKIEEFSEELPVVYSSSQPPSLDDSIRQTLRALNYSDAALNKWIERQYNIKCTDWRTMSTRYRQEALSFLDDLAERKGVKAVF